MHIDILIEDQSGKAVLDELVPRIIPEDSSCKIIAYKGIGHLRRDLSTSLDVSKRVLLDRLPSLLEGYGQAQAGYPDDYPASVVIVCDLDARDKVDFLAELTAVLDNCIHRPNAFFCLSVEEGEAWLLGDKQAVKTAYPDANDSRLNAYEYDSICGTWECLADIVLPNGKAELKNGHLAGAKKREWADKISPNINIEENMSPSFQFFRDTLRQICK